MASFLTDARELILQEGTATTVRWVPLYFA